MSSIRVIKANRLFNDLKLSNHDINAYNNLKTYINCGYSCIAVANSTDSNNKYDKFIECSECVFCSHNNKYKKICLFTSHGHESVREHFGQYLHRKTLASIIYENLKIILGKEDE